MRNLPAIAGASPIAKTGRREGAIGPAESPRGIGTDGHSRRRAEVSNDRT